MRHFKYKYPVTDFRTLTKPLVRPKVAVSSACFVCRESCSLQESATEAQDYKVSGVYWLY